MMRAGMLALTLLTLACESVPTRKYRPAPEPSPGFSPCPAPPLIHVEEKP
jgi:hypothetical protein